MAEALAKYRQLKANMRKKNGERFFLHPSSKSILNLLFLINRICLLKCARKIVSEFFLYLFVQENGILLNLFSNRKCSSKCVRKMVSLFFNLQESGRKNTTSGSCLTWANQIYEKHYGKFPKVKIYKTLSPPSRLNQINLSRILILFAPANSALF